MCKEFLMVLVLWISFEVIAGGEKNEIGKYKAETNYHADNENEVTDDEEYLDVSAIESEDRSARCNLESWRRRTCRIRRRRRTGKCCGRRRTWGALGVWKK